MTPYYIKNTTKLLNPWFWLDVANSTYIQFLLAAFSIFKLVTVAWPVCKQDIKSAT